MTQALNVLLALKRWIRVQVPKIEDGNNFGVSVQLDVAKGIDDLTTPVASSLGERHAYARFDVKAVQQKGYVDFYKNVAACV